MMYLISHLSSQDYIIEVPCDLKYHVTFCMQAPHCSHHSVKFGGHRHCGIGHTVALVCYMILQEYVTKGSYDFLGGILLW